MDFEALIGLGYSRELALKELNKRDGWYDPEILDVLADLNDTAPARSTTAVSVTDLRPGMVLAAPRLYLDGGPLFKQGQPLTDALIQRTWAVADSVGLREPIEVYLPTEVPANNPRPLESRLATQADDLHARPTENSEVRSLTETDPALRTAFPGVFRPA